MKPMSPDLLAPSLLSALLLLPLSCGPAEVPQSSACPSVLWGGWNGTPDCAGLSMSVISGESQTCRQHEDCAIVGANSCTAHSVNRQAFDRYSSYPPPCTAPLIGNCPQVPRYAVCSQGCCTASTTPPSAVAY